MDEKLQIDPEVMADLAAKIQMGAQEYITVAAAAKKSLIFDGTRAGIQEIWRYEADRLCHSLNNISALIQEHGMLTQNYAFTLQKHTQSLIDMDCDNAQFLYNNR